MLMSIRINVWDKSKVSEHTFWILKWSATKRAKIALLFAAAEGFNINSTFKNDPKSHRYLSWIGLRASDVFWSCHDGFGRRLIFPGLTFSRSTKLNSNDKKHQTGFEWVLKTTSIAWTKMRWRKNRQLHINVRSQQQIYLFDVLIKIAHSKLNLRLKTNFHGFTKEKAVFGRHNLQQQRCARQRKASQNRRATSKCYKARTNMGFQCLICDQSFTRKGSLVRHVQSIRCEFAAISKSKLKQKKMGFQCSICDESFASKGNLVRHFRANHKSEKKFHQCEICPFSLFDKSHLQEHVRSVHEKARPFKCELCNFCSRRKATLEEHVTAVHSREKPFSCNRCHFLTGQKSTLKTHIKNSWKAKAFQMQ